MAPDRQDPAGAAELGAAFVTERASWPPTWVPTTEATGDPERVGLPNELPPRPGDLAGIRRRRRLRTVAQMLAGVAVVALAAAGARANRGTRPTK